MFEIGLWVLFNLKSENLKYCTFMQDWTITGMSSDSWKNIKDLVILEADVLKED